MQNLPLSRREVKMSDSDVNDANKQTVNVNVMRERVAVL